MFQYWQDAAGQARRDGYSALRGTGETEWTIRGARGMERWMEYESRLTQVLQQSDCLALCQYNRRRFVPEVVLDVIRTHPTIVYGKLACRNFYFVPPEEFLEPDHSGREVERMLNSILERERLDQAMRHANEELELRVRQRTAELESFTSSVSHDLRAPLRQIDGFAGMLQEAAGPRLEPAERKCLEHVRGGCRHMRQLIDDLLGLAHMGQREPSIQLAGMRALAEEALAGLQQEMAGREIRVEIGDMPFVECDPDLVRQVWANLLSNAIKFTRPRSPAVIEAGCAVENGRRVFFTRDNGVGFSMRYGARLFRPFQRLHRQEDFEGTGVGLALVARIVEKHRGRVWAEGKLNDGATFYFTLGR
jgi:light-regulated signal transduction histidine kinase (bacteriophytochrome)